VISAAAVAADERDEFPPIAALKDKPPMLIVLDALVEMIGDLDEDRAKDIQRVYANIWRLVRATGSAVLVLHHTGWDKTRERGSSALRPANDILGHVTQFDAVKGEIRLKHNKRRGGAKLDDFAFEVKLVSVPGYPQAIPIVTGKIALPKGINLKEKFRRSANAQVALDVLTNQFPHGALRHEWLEAYQLAKGGPQVQGASPDTFDRVKKELLVLGDVVADGEGKGAIYRVKSTTGEAAQDSPQDYPHVRTPRGGAEHLRTKPSANDPQCGENAEDASKSSDFADATESHNEVPLETDPAEAERWRAMRDYEEQMSRERTAKATGVKPGDVAGEAMEQLRKRKS
jgi:hypothetical protein